MTAANLVKFKLSARDPRDNRIEFTVSPNVAADLYAKAVALDDLRKSSVNDSFPNAPDVGDALRSISGVAYTTEDGDAVYNELTFVFECEEERGYRLWAWLKPMGFTEVRRMVPSKYPTGNPSGWVWEGWE